MTGIIQDTLIHKHSVKVRETDFSTPQHWQDRTRTART